MANFTYPTNVTRFYEMMQYMNTVTQDWFGNLILIMVFTITFMSVFAGQRNVNIALMTSSFLSTITCILLRLAGMVGDGVLVIFITATIVSFIILNYSK